MQITSPVFHHNSEVPVIYTCNGSNVNPPLVFHDIPQLAKSLVLLVQDVNAPEKPWVHWLVYNIPPTVAEVRENAVPEAAVQGICNGGTYGYEGPCPIYFTGIHQYVFTLYALDTLLDVPITADKEVVLAAMEGDILEQAELVGIAEGTK